MTLKIKLLLTCDDIRRRPMPCREKFLARSELELIMQIQSCNIQLKTMVREHKCIKQQKTLLTFAMKLHIFSHADIFWIVFFTFSLKVLKKNQNKHKSVKRGDLFNFKIVQILQMYSNFC